MKIHAACHKVISLALIAPISCPF